MTNDTRDALLGRMAKKLQAMLDRGHMEWPPGEESAAHLMAEYYEALRTPRTESDARDAARYRWLRDNAWNAIGQVVCWFEHDDGGLGESVTFKGEHFDAAIDAALTQPEATR